MRHALATLSVLAAGAVAAAPAGAAVSLGAAQTLGSASYRSTRVDASLDLGESAYVAPSLATYRSDDSSGTYNNFGLRVGYEAGPLSFGVHGSVQPRVDGYRRSALGADVTFSLAPGGTKHGHRMAGPSSESNETFGYGLAGVDVGAGVDRLWHSDEFAAAGTSGTGLRRQGAARAAALDVAQTDVSVFAGAKFLVLELSAQATKSAYSKDIDAGGVREAQFLALPGVNAIVQGFPDTSANAKVKWKTLPLVRPFLSYTHTTFKLGASPSNSVEIGGNVGLDMLNVQAAYESYTQKGFPDRNYVTIGASLNF